MGVGVLPGPGRSRSVEFTDGERSMIPFPRSEGLGRRMEPILSAFMSDVSAVLHAVLPRHLMRSHEPPPECPLKASAMYQYPRLREGASPLSSH